MTLLNAHTVIDHLVGRGLLHPDKAATATASELSGGVSSLVFAVAAEDLRVIVKQSLERLRVKDEWHAPTDRTLSEAAMLRVVRPLTPTHVPAVMDVDTDRMIICIQHAPGGWTDWKTQLLAGNVRRDRAASLGSLLAIWHTQTMRGRSLPASLTANAGAFESLRIDPYYRATAARLPALSKAILETADRTRATSVCLVHGDFSPKNILGPSGRAAGFWVIDCEVAHLGDPTFDVAFLVTHLLLKSIHLPDSATVLRQAATDFLRSYWHRADAGLYVDRDHLDRQVGCLLLARVHGKSPVEYLSASEREAASQLGEAVLVGSESVLAPPMREAR